MTEPTEPPFGPQAFQQATGATPAALEDLAAYRELLAAWNERMNLVGPSALDAFWLRHAWDCAQLLSFAPDAVVWADLGTGAGLPGVILAILLKQRSGATVHLVESLAKRCRFLEAVAQALDLPVVIHNQRAESAHLPGIEVVTARACAPMIKLLGFAEPFLRQGATGLFLKGRDAPAEIEDARRRWRFSATLTPSLSALDGNVVKIERLSRV